MPQAHVLIAPDIRRHAHRCRGRRARERAYRRAHGPPGRGVAASPLARTLDVPLDRTGRVQVAPDLTLPGPEIFVADDLASIEAGGTPVPGVAPAAKQMGKHIARTIRARLAGKAHPPFRYRDYGNLATIGRRAAVVDLARPALLRLPGLDLLGK